MRRSPVITSTDQQARRRAPWSWIPRGADRRAAERRRADAAPRRLEPLDDVECWRLIRSDSVGRLVYTYQALPAVVPVNYVVLGESVLVRTSAESRIGQLPDGTVVAFEVDSIDRRTRTGWSVVLVGSTQALHTTPEGMEVALHLPGVPWLEVPDGVTLRISAGFVTGRHLLPAH